MGYADFLLIDLKFHAGLIIDARPERESHVITGEREVRATLFTKQPPAKTSRKSQQRKVAYCSLLTIQMYSFVSPVMCNIWNAICWKIWIILALRIYFPEKIVHLENFIFG